MADDEKPEEPRRKRVAFPFVRSTRAAAQATPEAGQLYISTSPPTGVAEAVGYAGPRSRSLVRHRAESVEELVRALTQRMRDEVARLREERRNDPDFQETIDFLTAAVEALDQIADEIRAAREAAGENKAELFAKAEASVHILADLAKEFAARHRERLVDFGGHATAVSLGTILLTILGVTPDFALGAVMTMYGLSKK